MLSSTISLSMWKENWHFDAAQPEDPRDFATRRFASRGQTCQNAAYEMGSHSGVRHKCNVFAVKSCISLECIVRRRRSADRGFAGGPARFRRCRHAWQATSLSSKSWPRRAFCLPALLPRRRLYEKKLNFQLKLFISQ